MGAYAYCRHPGCDAGLDSPTLSEIEYDLWHCHAGHNNTLPGDKADLLCAIIRDMQERLADLTADVRALENT